MKKIITLLLVLAPAYIVANRAGAFEEPPASASSSLSTSSSQTSSLSSSAADDDDDVADAIMGEGVDRKAVVQEYLGSLPDAQKRLMQRHLNGLTDDEFASYMVKLGVSRWWGSKKPEDKDKVAAATMALVRVQQEQVRVQQERNEELRRQTEEMRGSGELQKAAYEQQVESAKFARSQWMRGFIGAVGTAVVTNAIQAVFNIMQANTLAEQSDNATAC